jgi:caspase domain-containing protein
MLRIAGAVFLLLAMLPSMAQAERRVALVIGNSAYKHAGELPNPRNDATDIAGALKALKFEVIEGRDLDRAAMERKLREFARALEGSDVGLFFYAGHGLQAKGVNYLLGTDAKLEAERDLEFETLKLETVLTHMEREAKTNIVFLDACRNNPLARNLARTMGTRGVNENNGLAPVASGLGTFVAFATQPGNVASDGADRNSPFSAALKKHIAEPGLALSDLMIQVRKEVVEATKSMQVPWDHSALQGRFYFNITINVLPPQPAPPGSPQLSAAAAEWSRLDKTSIVELETFLRRHGSSPEADYARPRLADLKKQVVIPTPPPSRPKEKNEHTFDGNWEVSGIRDNCSHPSPNRWKWEAPIRIDGSHILRNGSVAGRMFGNGNFEFAAPRANRPTIRGTYSGKLQADSGQGTYRFPDCAGPRHDQCCSGSIVLKRL